MAVGASDEPLPNRGVIWDPSRFVLPNAESVSVFDVSVTNCDGTVFASSHVLDSSTPNVSPAIRQTRTSAPQRLAFPPDRFGAPTTSIQAKSFSADGSQLVGYAQNDNSDRWPVAARWDATGAVTVLFDEPRFPLVISPDGLHIAGHGHCTSPGCPGTWIWDFSEAEGEGEAPQAVFWAYAHPPVLSHDRTTVAGPAQDGSEQDFQRRLKWARRGGESATILCFAEQCSPFAISSHGSVVLISNDLVPGQAEIWTEARGLRLFSQFLVDAGVQLPPEAGAAPLVPTAMSDDARVIVGYVGLVHSRPFRITLSRRAYL